MKLLDLRKELKQKFKNNAKEESDVDFIISEVLNVSRTELVLIDEILDKDVETIREKANMRLDNIPVDKIFNKAYFCGLEYYVDEFVLTPRPESELLVEEAIKYIKENNYKSALDMCTGSGCLAITIQKNTGIDMTAVDISNKALSIAKKNAKKIGAEINFIQSDMFDKVEGKYDIIISNPPYIDSDEVRELDKEVIENDPILALDGGEFGLKFYNIIHDNIRKYLNDNGVLIIEIGNEQKDLIMNLFNDCHFVKCIKDYEGHDRIMVFKK